MNSTFTEFNFTDGYAGASIRAMSNEIHPTPPTSHSVDAAQQHLFQAAQNAEGLKTSSLFRQWFERAGSALKRAEQRIMDSFKVPPNGG